MSIESILGGARSCSRERGDALAQLKEQSSSLRGQLHTKKPQLAQQQVRDALESTMLLADQKHEERVDLLKKTC
ncbi:hypothetical protein N7453_008205 [Penicillium expansum]|nr:hypothetical protein N7453_008205 [Penicillium expansum]